MNQRTLPLPHRETPCSRRDFLTRSGGGMGMLALLSLLERNGQAASAAHFKPAAKSIIWCFLDGGPSHVDLFDPKPALTKLDGQPLPGTFKRPVTAMGRTAFTPLLGSKRTFKRYGKSGQWVSDWYPEIATCVDDVAFLKGCYADGLNHVGSVCQMNTGSVLGGRPCLGSWSLYGLGSVSDNLPGYVVLLDYPEDPPGGSRNWSTGFMPATLPGHALLCAAARLCFTLSRPGADAGQRAKLDFIQELNRRHRQGREDDSELEARIASYELAFKMHASAPEAVDLAASRRKRSGCTAWTARRRNAWAQLSAGAASGGARRPLRAGRIVAPAASGTLTATSRPTTPATAAKVIGPSRGCSRILNGAASSTRRWWSGAASSVAPR